MTGAFRYLKIAVLFAFVWAEHSLAMSCIERFPADNFFVADIVVSGEAVGQSYAGDETKVKLRTLETFKGKSEKHVTIIHKDQYAGKGYFHKGTKYLVFATKNDKGEYRTYSCDFFHRLKDYKKIVASIPAIIRGQSLSEEQLHSFISKGQKLISEKKYKQATLHLSKHTLPSSYEKMRLILLGQAQFGLGNTTKAIAITKSLDNYRITHCPIHQQLAKYHAAMRKDGLVSAEVLRLERCLRDTKETSQTIKATFSDLESAKIKDVSSLKNLLSRKELEEWHFAKTHKAIKNLIRKGEYEKALKLADETEKYSSNPEARLVLLRLYLGLDRFFDAESSISTSRYLSIMPIYRDFAKLAQKRYHKQAFIELYKLVTLFEGCVHCVDKEDNDLYTGIALMLSKDSRLNELRKEENFQTLYVRFSQIAKRHADAN